MGAALRDPGEPDRAPPGHGAKVLSAEDEILRIRLRDGARFVGVAASAAAGAAEGLDYASPDVDRVRSVVEALCADVVQNHFDDPREAEFTLILCERHGGLLARLEDQGLPYPAMANHGMAATWLSTP